MNAFHLDSLLPKPFRNEADQAIGPLLWGVYLSPTFQWALGHFIDIQPTQLGRLLGPVPLWAWSAIATGLGIYRFAAAYWLDLNHREYAAVLCSILWLTIAELFLVRIPSSPTCTLYLWAAYQSLASMGRIRMIR